MTAVRPENSAGGAAGVPGQPRYRDPADFAHAVDQLADPLSDPLPGPGGPAQQPAGYQPEGAGWYGQGQPQAHQPQAHQHQGHQHQDHQHQDQPQAQPPHYDAYYQQQAPQQQAPAQQPPHAPPPGYPQHGHPLHGHPPQPAAADPHGRTRSPGYPGPGQAQDYQGYDPYQASYGSQASAEASAPGYPAQDPYGASASGYGQPDGVHEPSPEREPPRSTRRRLTATAQLPVLDDPFGSYPDADDAGRDAGGGEHDHGGRADGDRTDEDGHGDDDGHADPGGGLSGGRAERRKAARRGGRRAAGGTAGTALALPAGGDGENLPVSRVEARRAARAAKTSPGVIASQVTGELFITMGVLMLLFVVYQLWYTNVLADEASGSATNSLQHKWDTTKATSDAGQPDSFKDGTVFAIIYIPKLDVKAPIAEGVEKTSILDKGEVGHYSGDMETAMPWDKSGNFALAAHRNTHGEPFRFIDQLHPGDKVVVETTGMYYTYAITSGLDETSPANVSVIEPVPPGSGFTGPGRYITLTTCTPQYTSEYRLIKWGKLVAQQPKSQGVPAALSGG